MPPKVGAGVAALIIRDDKLLMIQRTGSHGAGLWSVPGGWIEHGERAARAARREVQEEVGIDIETMYPLDFTEDLHMEGVHDVCIWILCDPHFEGEPRICEPEKITAVEWWTLEQIMSRTDDLFLPLLEFIGKGMLDVAFDAISTQENDDGHPSY